MRQFSQCIVLVASLLVAGLFHSAAAQTASSSALSMASAPPSHVTVSQTLDSWSFCCTYGANGSTMRVLGQELSAQDHGTRAPLRAVLIAKDQRKSQTLAEVPSSLTSMTLRNIMLSSLVIIAVRNEESVIFSYQTCTTQGCLSTGEVPPAASSSAAAWQDRLSANHQDLGGTVTINFGLGGSEQVVDVKSKPLYLS